MSEVIFTILELAFIASIFALAFFSAVKPNINIARWFYLIFGVSLIPITPKLMEDVEAKWLMVWPLLFAFAAIFMFVVLTKTVKKVKGSEEEDEINKKFQDTSIRGGKRRLSKTLLKNFFRK